MGYGRREPEVSKIEKKRNSSNVWKGINEAKGTLIKGLRMEVHNGENTLFSPGRGIGLEVSLPVWVYAQRRKPRSRVY